MTDTIIRCPDWPKEDAGDLIGCGSANVTGPDSDGTYECSDCGLWFLPEEDPCKTPEEVKE